MRFNYTVMTRPHDSLVNMLLLVSLASSVCLHLSYTLWTNSSIRPNEALSVLDTVFLSVPAAIWAENVVTVTNYCRPFVSILYDKQIIYIV